MDAIIRKDSVFSANNKPDPALFTGNPLHYQHNPNKRYFEYKPNLIFKNFIVVSFE